MKQAFVVALLGAAKTGKSTLALQLADALRGHGYRVQLVSEFGREWCQAHHRLPLPHEQASIASVQTQRIQAIQDADVVIADTTALMTAVSSDLMFGDHSLYAAAQVAQTQYNLTLLMGLDMPWVANDLKQDSVHERDRIDDLIRQSLQAMRLAVPTIYGIGDTRLQAALAMVLQAMRPPTQRSPWQHFCDGCGDGACEQKLFIAARAK